MDNEVNSEMALLYYPHATAPAPAPAPAPVHNTPHNSTAGLMHHLHHEFHNLSHYFTPSPFTPTLFTNVTPIVATTLPHSRETIYAILANASSLHPTDNGTSTALAASPEQPLDTGGSELIFEEHAPTLSHSTMIKVYVLSVMAVLSLLGNVLTMWNIYKTRLTRRRSRHTWSAIYSLIFHLSIADVLVTAFCIIGDAVWFYTVEWLADELTCKLMKLFQMFSLYLSTYVLVLIGVDRWIAVKYPMKSLNMAKRCHRLLGATYILSFLLSLPQFFIFHLARGPFIEEFYQCVTHGFYTAHWQEQLYTTFTLVFTFLMPLCILFVTYMSTFCTISSSEKVFFDTKVASQANETLMQTNRQRLIRKAKIKSLRLSVVIIIAFIICWTPYYVMMIIVMFLNPDKELTDGLSSAIFAFGMSNSLVNPLIYAAFHMRPMKRTGSEKGGYNNAHSLNRADSQRNPSMLTAVTQVQVDGNGRQIRTYRQPSYYRTHSTGSNSKEHVSLLEMSPTPALMHKYNSDRSPLSSGSGDHTHTHSHPHSHTHNHSHKHSTNLICNQLGALDDARENASSRRDGINSRGSVVL